ncbi:class I SAM-dependent methyltransferase [Herminiimonas contaminans]|uniref:Class I SAM-dependent methyltransferase n=1 Tax=Herminiimonas contaminans TaxID=1111140 RepID=A0ABS0EPA3_9BURK|nr:class I SAM-dependent methyltransferase [Herminiimonas contaminans]MBF8176677.1 class I SAM-dependent methyltransferase [Herminiimonas contaminans]
MESEDEDQIYEVIDDNPVYRTEHQVKTLLDKLDLKPGTVMLDYGCAKSSTYRTLSNLRPDLQLHLFDVSERYVPFWSTFSSADNWSTYTPRPEWEGKFEVITSFFAFEHIVEPNHALANVAKLLKPGGKFYCIVPNIFTNIADFVVVDHINHFTEASLLYLFSSAGFNTVEIDTHSHRGAFVIIAEKSSDKFQQTDVSRFVKNIQDIATFWSTAATKTREFERTLAADEVLAIYGAGFYGTFLYTALESPERVTCFLDQNPFLVGHLIQSKPVIKPADINVDVTTLLVGLNPVSAKGILKKMPDLDNLRKFFL